MNELRLRGGFEARLSAKPVEVSDKLLAKINAMPSVLRPQTKDDLSVFEVWLCNDKPFKDGARRFRPAALAQMARMASGVPALAAHSITEAGPIGLPIGTTIDGRTEVEDGATWLVLRYYVLHEQPFLNGRGIVKAVEGGMYRQSSAGLIHSPLLCSICDGKVFGPEACEHALNKEYGGKECLAEIAEVFEFDEWSFVADGMIDGTRFRLAAARSHPGVMDSDDALAAALCKKPREADPFAAYMASGRVLESGLVAYWGSAGT